MAHVTQKGQIKAGKVCTHIYAAVPNSTHTFAASFPACKKSFVRVDKIPSISS